MISIVIPLYNKREAIARTINSVLSQTCQDWELIIIDDGSTDGSGEIVSSFLSDKRIRYIRKPNGGVSSARNRGIAEATGEWIAYIDADDYFLPNALAALIDMTKKYGTDVVSGNYYAECDGKRRPVLHHVKNGIVKNNFRSLYWGKFDIRAGATLLRSSLIKQYHYDETLSRFEDAKIEFDILRSNRVAMTSEFLMVYSNDFNGLSKPSSDIKKDFISCMEFENKSMWEKLFLGRLLTGGIAAYPQHAAQLKQQYKGYLKWMYVNRVLSYYMRVRNMILNRLPWMNR